VKLKSSVLLLFFTSQLCLAELRLEDKLRISEAITISNIYGNAIWKGFSEVPFTLILVTDDKEYLMFHDQPSDDFTLVGYDSLLNTHIYSRKTQFNTSFLATFPAVNGVNCIVVGTPENTGLNSSDWIITLLHEHFHQYVNTSPNYVQEVERLHLSKGDTTGMWMLNYNFPYTNEDVISHYDTYRHVLQDLYNALKKHPKRNDTLKRFIKARQQFKDHLSTDDYNYFSFQLWQEGIARYTEVKFLEALKNHEVSSEVRTLPDYVPLNELYNSKIETEIDNVKTFSLNEQKRICFYAIGCLEGLVLDHLNPNWRTHYLKNKFYLENYKQDP